jgi:hypothetical protein
MRAELSEPLVHTRGEPLAELPSVNRISATQSSPGCNTVLHLQVLTLRGISSD